MPLKATANELIYRVTGHRLTRETPEQRRAAVRQAVNKAVRQERRRAAEKAAAQQAAAKKAAQQAAAHKAAADRAAAAQQAAEQRARRIANQRARADRYSYWDDTKRSIITRVDPRTMTGPPKLDPLVEAVRHIVRHQIPGEVVECGVWRGGSMQAMALTLLSLDDTSRELHLFDTFEGMPPPTADDTQKRADGTIISAADALARSARDSRVWAVAGLDDVQEAMAESGYPADRIQYHVGMVEDTLPAQAPQQIAILRLDTDWYSSTKHELETLYERLSPGGVLMLDDYSTWDGARKATDEWLAATGEMLFLVPMGPGRIAIKPLIRDQQN